MYQRSFCALNALLALNLQSVGAVTQLPKIHATAPPSSLVQQGKWWAQAGNHIVHAPHQNSELSPNIENYYYAYGSHSALTQELQDKRVGGDGRLHIFHLPEGVDSLAEKPTTQAARRDALSALLQLEHKKVLSDAKTFPIYQLSDSYQSGLDAAGKALENQIVQSLDEQTVYDQLVALTKLGDGATMTRSYSNPEATKNTIDFLEKNFKDMGYDICMESRTDGQKSVIAYKPGQTNEDGVVVLGAHYDSRPFEGLAPGAVDNGSGAAAVLSIARAVAQAKLKPRRPIVFAAFAAEEPGLLGSEEFATRLKSSSGGSSFLESHEGDDGVSAVGRLCDGKIAQLLIQQESEASLLQDNTGSRKKRGAKTISHEALVMDEIAWKSTNLKADVVNLESYDWASHVLEHLAQSSTTHNGQDLTITHSSNPFGSDHMSFLTKGFQAVLSIHGDDEAYPYYHSEKDDMLQVNKSLYAKIVKMNAGALVRLAGVV
eukprot:TRINITY_DN33179_c0_g1_i1.p1 TRINITY_DN33179_c0_g1~~TRINITY_DN33179_c0_g1_i1.p1  ORF type:complete len:488 (-),score=107.19 TRINITY_DN33179_c0_g1_i1:148-1611(-)